MRSVAADIEHVLSIGNMVIFPATSIRPNRFVVGSLPTDISCTDLKLAEKARERELQVWEATSPTRSL